MQLNFKSILRLFTPPNFLPLLCVHNNAALHWFRFISLCDWFTQFKQTSHALIRCETKINGKLKISVFSCFRQLSANFYVESSLALSDIFFSKNVLNFLSRMNSNRWLYQMAVTISQIRKNNHEECERRNESWKRFVMRTGLKKNARQIISSICFREILRFFLNSWISSHWRRLCWPYCGCDTTCII